MASAQSDEKRFELLRELMEAYSRDVFRVVYGYVHNKHTAEDISQDVFLKVYDHMESFRQESSYKTWILRIAANCAKDFLRASARRAVTAMDDMSHLQSDGSVEQAVMAAAQGSALWQAVQGLPDTYREVIWLYYAQDLSVEEIAQVTELSQPAIKTRLFRGRELLRTVWEGSGERESTGRS
ncbi:MAG: sigma-70 family RNA polymerase sigma factor [Bacilli bacterium]